MATIYLLRCTVSNKLYVGQTIQPWKDRWSRHCTEVREGYRTHLYNAIRKYGELAFEMTIIREGSFTSEELDDLEKLWIKALRSHESQGGYNQTWGGTEGAGRWHKGRKRSPETCEKIRQTKLGAKNPMFGKKNPKGSFRPGEQNPNHGLSKSEIWKKTHGETMKRIWEKRSPESKTAIVVRAGIAAGKQAEGKIWVNKETERKRINPGDLDQYLRDGWHSGMKPVQN
jgi:group I intron endonuclease